MKASIVYNTKEEPRILIELEDAKERKLLHDKIDSLRLIRVGYNNDVIADLAFEVVAESDLADQR